MELKAKYIKISVINKTNTHNDESKQEHNEEGNVEYLKEINGSSRDEKYNI